MAGCTGRGPSPSARPGAHMVIRSGDEAVGKCVGVSKCVLRDLAALASEADKLAGADAKAYVDDVFREIILSRLGCKGAESYGSERWGQVAEAYAEWGGREREKGMG